MGKSSRNKRDRVEAPPSAEAVIERRLPVVVKPFWALLLLAILATFIYSNTFSSSFHFDDLPNIVDNPQIKDLANFADISGARYVGFFTFALNYYFGGTAVFGYHLVNLLIHVFNGFLVYCLVQLLFKAKDPDDSSHFDFAPWVALATGVLFIVHPVQTQAVTYIVQRFASLAALFYLLAVVCYLQWRLSESTRGTRHLWYVGALLSTVLAMKTKETTFTLPFMLILVEWTFFRPSTARRWAALLPFLLTLPIIPLSHLDALGEAEPGLTRQTTGISRSSYLFTQFRVIVTYLRLLVLPIDQILDYDYPVYHSFLNPPVFLSFLLLASLFSFALYLLFRTRFKLAAFGLLWLFLALSAESSIFPIEDVIFEHRLYLPVAGAFLAVVALLMDYFRGGARQRWLVGAFLVIVLILGSATYQRNLVWQDDLTLWRDEALKSPHKPRVRNTLGVAYESKGMHDAAVQEYQAAIKLNPNLETAHNNLGNTYAKQGALDKAVEEYQKASELKQDYASPHVNLGNVYASQGRLEDAVREYETAIKRAPTRSAAVHNRLAVTYARMERLDEATREFQAALKIEPKNPEILTNLGIAFMQLGRKDEAVGLFKRALVFDPSYKQAHSVLDAALKSPTKN